MKYALVTGSSRGIGKAIAIRLAKMGYPVLINYLKNKEAAEEVVATIIANGGQAELMPFNAADGKAIEAALDAWESAHPDDYIAVLVNNAGIRKDNVLFMMSDEEWHEVLDTTLNGYFYLTRRLLKHMMPRRRGGRIVNMASLSGVKGLAGQSNYSAAKAALIGATKALAQEEELKKLVPVGRFGTAEEVAAAVAFLVSDEAAYITGEVININGGLYT